MVRGQGAERLGDLPRLPLFVVDEAAELVLELIVAQGLGFAEQQGRFRRQLLTSLDHRHEGVHQVVQVQECLPMGDMPRKDVTREPPLVDSLDLVCQRYRVAVVVVDPRKAEEDDWDRASLGAEERFSLDLRVRVVPPRVHRGLLGDVLSGDGQGVDEHGAREDELLDLKRLEFPQQALGSADGDLLILGPRVAGEVVVRGEVDHGP